jgi:hypothetical protein
MVEHRNVCVIFQSGVFMSYEFFFFFFGGGGGGGGNVQKR